MQYRKAHGPESLYLVEGPAFLLEKVMNWLSKKKKPEDKPVEYHPTAQLRWVKRHKTYGQEEYIEMTLQQLWRFGPWGYGNFEWRDVPVTTEDNCMNDDNVDS